MKILQIASTNLEESLKQLQLYLGGEVEMNLKERELFVNSKTAYGRIRAVQLKGGISFLQFNMTFKEDVKIVFNSPTKSFVNFMYCSEGKVSHTFNNSTNRIELETFQTGILSNISQEQNNIYFERDEKVSASIISVNTLFSDGQDYTINKQLRQQFIAKQTEDVAFVGSYNLKIAERIKQLHAIRQEGVVRTLLIEGLVHIILALEIEQHKNDLKSIENNLGSLTSKEMALVKDLSEFINNFPETSLTVTKLSHKIGLSASKLQEGFKLMHGRTINDYIRDVRLTKSEELIKTTDMNISQILYTLGFSSRSYFSKIFKAKYNCSPRQYKIQNKLAVSA